MQNSNLSRRIFSNKNLTDISFNINWYSVTRTLSKKTHLPEHVPKTREELLKDVENAIPYEDMPQVPSIPLFGSTWMYFPFIGKYDKNRMHKADLLKKKTYGDVVRERYGKFEIVTSYHPETMRVLAGHEGKYPARADFSTIKAYRRRRSYLYNPLGLIVMQGKEWKDFRVKIGRHVLGSDVKKLYIELMNDVSRDLVNLIRVKRDSKNEVRIMDLLYKWALESISYLALDARLDCLNPNLDPDSDGMKMIDSVHTQLGCFKKLEAACGNIPYWKYFPTPTWELFVKAADVFSGLAFKYIKRAMNDSSKPRGEKEQITILQKMLMDKNIDVSDAMVAVADIMMAGIDTTSHAACYVLYNLAKNPNKQEIAYQEILHRLPRKDDILTKEIRIPYITWCVKESLRLHPVVRGNLRIFDHDVIVQGYRVPAGTAVMCINQVMCRDERFFDDPNQFIPERWADPENIPQFTYAPFGYGKRSCLGQHLAEMEITSVVIEILRNYSLEYHYQEMGMLTRLINVPDRVIYMRFLDR